MEQTRIANTPAAHGTAASRAKPATAGQNEGLATALQGTDFLALLGFLAEELVEAEPLLEQAKPEPAAGMEWVQGQLSMPWLLAQEMGVITATTEALSGRSEMPGHVLAPLDGEAIGQTSVLGALGPLSDSAPFAPGVSGALVNTVLSVEGITQEGGSASSMLESRSNSVTSPELSQGLSMPVDGLVAQTRKLDAAAEDVAAFSSPIGAYQPTLKRTQDGLFSVPWRGNVGSAGLGRGLKSSLSAGESVAGVVSVSAKIAERTVDLGQWSLRDTQVSALERSNPLEELESESLLSDQESSPPLASVFSSSPSGAGAASGGLSDGSGFEAIVVPEEGGGAAVSGEAFGLTTEEQVADQVAQWVGQTVHNAELTLDRDGQAVHVTVTLSGQEAQVHFRTDEGQARTLLDAHLSELRDMLRGQGVELAGAWVGTSQQQGEREPAADPRDTMDWSPRRSKSGSATELPLSAAPIPRPSQPVPGSVGLDVFA